MLNQGQGNPCGELETIARDCYRAFDGTNQETRRDIAKLLGTLVAYTQQVTFGFYWLFEYQSFGIE